MQGESKQHAWGSEKPCTKVHKSHKPVEWLGLFISNMHFRYPIVKLTIIMIIKIFYIIHSLMYVFYLDLL